MLPWAILLLTLVVNGAEDVVWRSDGPSLREACTNAYDYGDPTCLGNSTLYWGTGNDSDLSCAHCVCEGGWGGVDCGRCLDLSACPSGMVDGEVVPATNCTADTLLLTAEEAQSDDGKVFSCSCGGGEDGWTDFLCAQQPDTWIQWAVTGMGTSDDPAVVSLKEYAGIHAKTEEQWPGQYSYHYPKIFDGSAGPCKIYRDKCLPVEGTDVGDRDCVIFECSDTEGLCPPEEYPMCDGFPNCKTPSGKEYETHPCTAVPVGGKSITIACQEEKVNGSHVCYYQQPGAFAPLSMTCSVGSCLYQGGTPVPPSGSKTKRVSWSIRAQMVILLSVAGLLLISFLLFGIASDPRTAASAMAMITAKKKNKERINREPLVSVSNHRNPADKRSNGRSTFGTDGEVDDAEAWDDQDLSAPLLSSGSAVIGDGIGTYLGGSSTISDALGDDDTLVDQAEGRGSTVACDRADSTPHTSNLEGHRGDRGGTMGGRGEERMPLTSQWRQQHGADFIPGSAAPAVLRWKKLGYCVHGQGQSSGSEMVILKDVAGFAGPEEREQYNDPARRRSLPRTGNHFFSDIETRGTEGQPSSSSLASGTPSISTITGILGPSGAGKSSLLDLLAGRKCQGEGHSTGSVTLTFHGSSSAGNGCARGRGAGTDGGVEDVRKLGGYVPQEDVLPDTLTCYEHLMFHARLRMRTVQEGGGSSGADFDERVNRVLWVLEELGLKRVADSRIGDGLSGGERRRLSIAAELVARPALLFLDEPTTGLDAATALRVMKLLRGVASRGTTILCSLHQPRPRVLDLLDKVILLNKGRVAYFGSPRDAEGYFNSVGRPFPARQPHPADAMLTLCCREDGADLASLYRRSSAFFMGGSCGGYRGSNRALPRDEENGQDEEKEEALRVMSAHHPAEHPEKDVSHDQQDPPSGNAGSEATLPSSLHAGSDIEETELVDVGRGGAAEGAESGAHPEQRRGRRRELRQNLRDHSRARERNQGRRQVHQQQEQQGTLGTGKGGGEDKKSAPFLVQVEALSRRLLLRAVRHPLLLMLHFGGSIAMSLCLASVFGGRLGFNLEGAQNRFGALFFLLLYLSLLSLTSLPIWREDRRLFLSESMAGAYGHLPYFTSVALADILLIRVIPPLAFAVVGYPLMGLNTAPDNQACLLWFAGILVLANVTVALAAMGVGALGLPLDLSNLLGGLMVLLLAAFGRFLLNGTRIPWAWRWLSSITPLGYAFEALLINEFSDAEGIRPYVIEGSHCSPDLPVIEPLGPQILLTFSFSPKRSTMHVDAIVLAGLALGLSFSSLLVFFFATRTKPLLVGSAPSRIRSSSGYRNRNIRTRSMAVASSLRMSSDFLANPAHIGRTGSPKLPDRVRTNPSTRTTATAPAAPRSHITAELSPRTSAEPYSERSRERRRQLRRGGVLPTSDGRVRNSSRNEDGGVGRWNGGRSERSHLGDIHRDGSISRRNVADMEEGEQEGRRLLPTSPTPPLLLSWEGLRYSVPVKTRSAGWLGWLGVYGSSSSRKKSGSKPAAGCLLVLNGVSGFAGPSKDRNANGDGAERENSGRTTSDDVDVDAEEAAGLLSPSGPSVVGDEMDRDIESTGARRTTPEGASEGGVHRSMSPWSGTVTALMGPSGAGKTSLLNALAGRLQSVKPYSSSSGGSDDGNPECSASGTGLVGAIRLNGVDAEADDVRRVSGYVTQEDVLPETLTCYEHLMFHAHLRLPVGTSVHRRHKRVVEVLQELGLFEIRNSRIGGGLTRGISGGEKRRLSIGTELLTRPALLFLDEPTTGLDSSTALKVMQLVSRVASYGTTVLCSVHQPRPDVVKCLHKVILLSRGAVAFSGPPDEAEAYFASIGRPFVPLPGEALGATGVRAPDGNAAGDHGAVGTIAAVALMNPTDAMLDAIGDAEVMADRADEIEREGDLGGNDTGSHSALVAMPRDLLVEQVQAAESSGPPVNFHDLITNVETARTSPPLSTQLSALLRRSALNVARDRYLAALHILLTLCVGVVVGSLFRDLGRLNGSTAGVQISKANEMCLSACALEGQHLTWEARPPSCSYCVSDFDRLGVVFLLLLYLSLLCLTSLAAWRKQMSLFKHERASVAYGAAAHLITASTVDAVACRIVPPILLALTVQPLAGLRAGSLPGLVAGLVVYNLSLAAVLAACGAGARSSQEALATGCLVVLFSALLSGFLVAKDELPAGWGALAWVSPIGRGFEALVANEFSPYGAIFRLSTKIGPVTAYTSPMTGDAVLRCFGFNGGRYWADLGVMTAVGGCGLAVAFAFLKHLR